MGKRRRHRRPQVEHLRPLHECAWAPECSTKPTSVVAGLVRHPAGRLAAGVALVCDLHVGSALVELGSIVEPVVAPADEFSTVMAMVEAFRRDLVRHGS